MVNRSHIYTKLKGTSLDERLLEEFPVKKITKFSSAPGYSANWHNDTDPFSYINEMIDPHLASVLAANDRLSELGVTERIVYITIMDSSQGNFELSAEQLRQLVRIGASVAITVVYAKP